jgi:hypothetical protein
MHAFIQGKPLWLSGKVRRIIRTLKEKIAGSFPGGLYFRKNVCMYLIKAPFKKIL